jgi:3',5'-cyclic AMP phosphodiesterase CpdA
MIRLAHLSDIHVTSRQLEWSPGDWFTKRLSSWVNHRFFRGHFFARAEEILGRLMDELPARKIDHLIFSGDATALGFEAEVRVAAEALRVGQSAIPGLAVPGNHDYCTPAAARSGHFERYFAPWQEGRRIGAHRYPFAQQVGPVWLIGVNGATGNRRPWDAAGAVGADQLDRLEQLLADLPGAVKILVIHFPICLSDGRPEIPFHGLRDLKRVLAVAWAGGVGLWLHGHRHSPYHLQTPAGSAFPAICAGTATQRGLWSYGEYTIAENTLNAVRRAYNPEGGCFHDVETFTLHLPRSPKAPGSCKL